MTDAVHELSDSFNYVIAIGATIMTARKANRKYSYGYHRAETIGALVNVVSICVLAGMLVMQAIERLFEPEAVEGRCAASDQQLGTPWIERCQICWELYFVIR